MPLKALEFRDGQVVPIGKLLDLAAKGEVKGGWTYELLSALLATQQDRGDRISTTTLTSKCRRSEYLKRTTDYTDEANKLWASFRGTMFHGQLEWHAHPANIAEARYHVELEGLGPLSGSPDLVAVPAGVLYDYKNTKEVPRFDYAWPDHIAQVNVNRWLVDHAHRVEFQGEEFDLADPVNRTRFVPFAWDSLVLVYMDDKGPKPITVTRSEEVIGKNGRPKKVRVPDLWSDERCEDYIRRKYAAWKDSFESGVVPDIPEDFERWRHPLCGFCPVRDLCIDLYLDTIKEAS